MKEDQKNLISDIISRLIDSWDENGNTKPEYYQSICLPDLEINDLEYLKKVASFDI